ncbi:phosphatase PAP2 family protein [Candidatus Woesearchaeota archaeon]|nr:phosphatase PAP2 family protein [Candidatus Woesearchaeota archaeon]
MKKDLRDMGWIAFCLAGFFWITNVVVKNTVLFTVDHRIANYLGLHQASLLFDLMYLASFFASTIFITLFSASILLYFYLHHRNKEIISYVLTLFPGVAIGFLIKNIVQRVRPENLLEMDYSFPSLHATGSVLLYGWLAFHYWKQGKEKKAYLLFSLPLLIGLSRLYLGVHWFSDVIGGFLLGGAWLLLTRYGEKRKMIESLFSKLKVNR